MSALRELARLRGDDLKVLAWVLEHAPDGTEADVLIGLWVVEDQPAVLMEVIRQLRREEGGWLKRQSARRARCPRFNMNESGQTGCALHCAACCGAIRDVTPAPTWAELMGERA